MAFVRPGQVISESVDKTGIYAADSNEDFFTSEVADVFVTHISVGIVDSSIVAGTGYGGIGALVSPNGVTVKHMNSAGTALSTTVFRSNHELAVNSDYAAILKDAGEALFVARVNIAAMHGGPLKINRGRGEYLRITFRGDFTGLTANKWFVMGYRGTRVLQPGLAEQHDTATTHAPNLK